MAEVLDWTDEILLTRAELEDKNALIHELKTKIEEVKVHNEFQQKLKENSYLENIKEVTDKFYQELEQVKEAIQNYKFRNIKILNYFSLKLLMSYCVKNAPIAN
jgi:hypothetical protein